MYMNYIWILISSCSLMSLVVVVFSHTWISHITMDLFIWVLGSFKDVKWFSHMVFFTFHSVVALSLGRCWRHVFADWFWNFIIVLWYRSNIIVLWLIMYFYIFDAYVALNVNIIHLHWFIIFLFSFVNALIRHFWLFNGFKWKLLLC